MTTFEEITLILSMIAITYVWLHVCRWLKLRSLKKSPRPLPFYRVDLTEFWSKRRAE